MARQWGAWKDALAGYFSVKMEPMQGLLPPTPTGDGTADSPPMWIPKPTHLHIRRASWTATRFFDTQKQRSGHL